MNLTKNKQSINIQNVNIQNNMQYIQVPIKSEKNTAVVLLNWNKIFMHILQLSFVLNTCPYL